ncbi:hypothetical protein ACYULU_08760 [Breznakiellaceae bacterium SP9]
MNKRFVLCALLLLMVGAIGFSADTKQLVGKKLMVTLTFGSFYFYDGRESSMVVENVYTKHKTLEIWTKKVIEDVYDIMTLQSSGWQDELLGAASLYSDEFQLIIVRYLQRHASDDPLWRDKAHEIALIFANYVAQNHK